MNYRTGRPLWSREQLSHDLLRPRDHGLIEEEAGEYRLPELGRVAGEASIEVTSVLRVVEGLRGLALGEINPATLIAAAQLTEELDNVFFPIHRKSHQEHARWHAALREQAIPGQTIAALRSTAADGADYTARCKKIASTLMWIQGVDLRGLEASLLRHLPGDNAAGPIRAVAERTRDLIPVVARIAELLSSGYSFASMVDELLVRLEFGVFASMSPLARIAYRRLDRADYLALERANLSSPKAITAVTDDALLSIVRVPVKVVVLRTASAALIDEATGIANSAELPMPRREEA